jgi:hypothetical protein
MINNCFSKLKQNPKKLKYKLLKFFSTDISLLSVGVKYEHSNDSIDDADDDDSRYILILVLL